MVSLFSGRSFIFRLARHGGICFDQGRIWKNSWSEGETRGNPVFWRSQPLDQDQQNNKQNIASVPRPSKLTSGFTEFSVISLYPTMTERKFQIYGILITRKCIGESKKKKKWILTFLLMSPGITLPPGSHHHPPGRGKLLILPKVFSKIYFLPVERRGRKQCSHAYNTKHGGEIKYKRPRNQALHISIRNNTLLRLVVLWWHIYI